MYYVYRCKCASRKTNPFGATVHLDLSFPLCHSASGSKMLQDVPASSLNIAAWAPTSFGHYMQELSIHQCSILPVKMSTKESAPCSFLRVSLLFGSFEVMINSPKAKRCISTQLQQPGSTPTDSTDSTRQSTNTNILKALADQHSQGIPSLQKQSPRHRNDFKYKV